MKRTFVDAGVLIDAAHGEGPAAKRAMEIIDDSEREFASSIFLKMEVLPKAVYHHNQAEVEFYESFFNSVTHWAEVSDLLVEEAYREGCTSGVAAMDALHVAAAASVGATELITTEKPNKPIHRATSVRVVSIQSGGDNSNS